MKLKPLVQMMAMLPVMFFPTTATLHASDLSIYKGNTTGKTKIILMLDTSGSMGISSLVLPKNNQFGSPGDVVAPICESKSIDGYDEWIYNLKDTRTGSATFGKTAFVESVTIGGETINYYMRGCKKTINNVEIQQWDRISRLKNAIIPLLAGNKLDNAVEIGLGQFSSKTDITIGRGTSTLKLVDGHSGRIAVAAAILSVDQRKKLIKAIAALQSTDPATDEKGDASSSYSKQNITPPNIQRISGSTPTAHAYAEVGAYMLGTTTVSSTAALASNLKWVYDGSAIYRYDSKSQQTYWVCVGLKNTLSTALGYDQAPTESNVKQCDSPWPNDNVGGSAVGTLTYTLQKGGNINPKVLNGNDVELPNYSSEMVNGTLKEYYTGSANGTKNFTLTKDKIWEMVYNLPNGYRLGGWKKVPNEPMDIEPLSAKSWGQGVGKVLAIYRTNPFSLSEGTAVTQYTDNMDGGLLYSDSAAKPTATSKTYNQFGSASTCDGNGIYFLTDGAPNSTKVGMAESIMNKSLTGSSDISCPTTGGLNSPSLLKSSMFTGETGRWECIGEYAKRLRIRSENAKAMEVKTAVVGFGASFEGLNSTTDAAGNVTYDCNTVGASLDAQNACKWGSKGAGYGEGGFYQATNSEDIANSIINFVDDVTPTFASGSLGSISVPSDPLDQTRLMTTGFFPMVQPVGGAKIRTWAGNLKKYNIIGGTLKDVSNNAIYSVTNGKQVINKSAKDLWSSVSETDADHSSVESGGSWSKIPTPSLLNVLTDPSSATSVRNVFTMDGATLKPITKENLATDYTEANGVPALNSTNINLQKRYALLNYLGYQSVYPSTKTTITTTDINTLSTTKPNIPYRYLGGVVHSTPLVVTKKAVLESDSNAVSSRNEYVVYGSMEGGLHIVDGSTGIEQSVFVPQEILSNQPETLASIKASSDAGLAHGVDAPWVADNTFKLETQKIGDVDVTQYTANKMNIYGGLRMGGKAIYGLNIINPAKPTLLFQINNTTTGFDRLSQVWSKPTLADIRVAGVRQKVLIFGGGYDESIYEKDGTAFTEPTTATKGNALYIVNANTGVLIKSISSSSTGATGDQAEVKYSVVGQPVVLDYDSDGLADMIYFADLGGQMFRVDLNNAAQSTTVSPPDVMVRVKRISNLKETNFVPRFYDRLTAAVFDKGQDRFVLVTGGSGNRSYPLASAIQRNKIYGILDYNAATNGLEKSSFTAFDAVATSSNLANRGVLGRASSTLLWGTGSITNDQLKTAMAPNGTLRGWRFDLLSSQDKTNENYAKSFEESQLVSGDLYVNAYDPKSTLSGVSNECGGGVQGISTTHRICAPYADCAAYLKTSYEGISGPALGSTGSTSDPRQSSIVGPIAGTIEACIGKCGTENNPTLQEQAGKLYSKSRVVQMNRWFEK